MSTCDQTSHFAAIFTHLQALIDQTVDTKISELIASGGLVCSHCSRSSSTSSTSSTSTSSSSSSKVRKSESSMVQPRNLNSESKNVDSAPLLDDMHVNFETTMSKLQSALQNMTNNQQQFESTDIKQIESYVEFEKCITALAKRSVCAEVKTEQLKSDINNMAILHSVAVDRHEVLSTLVSNIGHKHNELAEFVRQLSQCTASADDVVELKAIVECMARVTGVSEHKAEQLIAQFIGREGVELEHVNRELRLVNDKIRELLSFKDQMTNMHDSAYQNQLPYLNVVTETMQRECMRYKRDLNTLSKRLSDCVNAKVAQAIQQSLVDKHEQNNKEQFDLPSTKTQNTLTELVQSVANDDSTLIQAATTAAVETETEPKRHQVTHAEDKEIAIISQLPSAETPTETSPNDTSLLREVQLSDSGETGRGVTRVRHSSNFDSKSLLDNLLRESRRFMSDRYNRVPVISCLVVGHQPAQTQKLKQAFVNIISGSSVIYAEDGVRVDVLDINGTVDFKLYLANCVEIKNLKSIIVCDIIVICFSIVDEVSYQHVRNVWLKQVKQVYPGIPYLLVGTQADLRQTTDFQVEYEQGVQLCREIGAVKYFECSSLDALSVEVMFMWALLFGINSLENASIE